MVILPFSIFNYFVLRSDIELNHCVRALLCNNTLDCGQGQIRRIVLLAQVCQNPKIRF